MYLAYLLLTTGLTISAVAIYYSVIGMAAIFAAAPIPIYIMGTTLEIAKLVGASWSCPYCGLEGRANMQRWHFDNCKEKA